jgi:maleylacetoacetate isomerase/maleylpyruvate isomerase
MEYLEEVYPEPALLPADPVARARVRALALSVACDIHPLNNLRVLKYLVRELKVSEDSKNEWYRHWCREGLRAVDRQLSRWGGTAYCVGDTPTVADCCLVPQVFNAQRFDVSLDDMPRVRAVFDLCMQHPAFQAADPARCPDAE